MKSIIWDKYQKLEEINENWNIKTYRARIEPIIKEISYKIGMIIIWSIEE